MAENFGSSTFYTGTVEHVVKTYGFITLHRGGPVKKAFFDRSSVTPRTDDLTDLFSKGSKIRANIIPTDGEHKVNYKAINIQTGYDGGWSIGGGKNYMKKYSPDNVGVQLPQLQEKLHELKHRARNIQAEQVEDSSIGGGKNYLKKYLLEHGAVQLEQLVEKLKSMTKNCPKFLRSGDAEDVKKVLKSHPNIFQIKLGFVYLVEEEKKLLDEILSSMDSYDNKIPLDSINSIIRPDHELRKYLHTTEQWNVGIKNFVARNANSLVFWDNKLWSLFVLKKNSQLNGVFKKELAAVKYYSEFVTKKGPLAMSSLSGHYNQASDEIKDVTKPKSEEFMSFLEKHSFFFVVKGGNVTECPEYRLAALDSWQHSRRGSRTRGKGASLSSAPSGAEDSVFHSRPNPKQDCYQRDVDPRLRYETHQDNRNRGGEQYMERYLAENGAYPTLNILYRLHKENDPSCPPYLKWGSHHELFRLAQQNPMVFSINNGSLCLNELENQLVATCATFEKLELNEVKNMFPSTRQPGKYLFALCPSGKWRERVKDFVARHPERFVFWQNFIWRKDALFAAQLECLIFERDMKAVKYYSLFMSPNEDIEIVSVSGHYGQADNEVKMATTQNTEDFTAFLKRNFFFFDIAKDKVKLSANGERLEIIHKFWLNTHMKSPVKPKPAARPKNPSRQTSTEAPKFPSKAFSDLAGEVSEKLVMRSNEDAGQHADRCNFQTYVNSQPSLHQSQKVEFSPGPTSSSSFKGACSMFNTIYDSPEALVFKQLVGDEMSSAIESEVLSLKESTLNSLLLLRLNVGKKPMAKFRLPVENGSFNCTLETRPVKAEDLQRILRQNVVVKSVTPLHYGVKGTLHSIRKLEQGGKVSGLTIFCQIHESIDELLLDIWNGKKLTAVFTGDYPVKHIYNYLRCRCEQLAQREDVLVLDVDGQLSGCDARPHPSLGGASRIQCSSSAELSDQINHAIQHMHEYVIIIGVDSEDHLKSIQKMCSKDTKVIAEVSSELKSKVEDIFL